MWVFLSSRIRTWVLLAVALPVLRAVVHRFSAAAQRRKPGSTSASLLHRAETTLDKVEQRRNQRGRKGRRARRAAKSDAKATSQH